MSDGTASKLKFHVRCTHISCRWHVTARGKDTAETVREKHEKYSGHDVELVEDSVVSFRKANALDSDPSTEP